MNTAAKAITCKRSMIMSHHYLLSYTCFDRQLIVFKILLYTFKAIHGVTPTHLTELIRPYVPKQALRSTDQLLQQQPTHKLKSIGLRAYLWNSLPFEMQRICLYF